jgi:hypothetical protein
LKIAADSAERSDSSTQLLRRALQSDVPWLRLSGLRTAGVFAATDLLDDIGRCVEDSDDNVRYAAAGLFGRKAAPAHLRRVLEWLTRADALTADALLNGLTREVQPLATAAIPMAREDGHAQQPAAIALLGTTSQEEPLRVLGSLLADNSPRVRSEAARAAARAARLGYPKPLPPALADRLLDVVAQERVESVLLAAIAALACSADARAAGGLLGRVPIASAAMRERLVEAGALIGQLSQAHSVDHRTARETR